MKVLVLGAGGVIGQHMMISVPDHVGRDAVFVRRTHDKLTTQHQLGQHVWDSSTLPFLDQLQPDVIVNLAGEAGVDTVERDPGAYEWINSIMPAGLAAWCDLNGKHLIHVSSQAVYSGEDGPYGPNSALNPVNEYGRQKAAADLTLLGNFQNFTIVRPTFVLGIRPMPAFGRPNPAEAMLAGKQEQQVDDRYFSIAFAWDVARVIWEQTIVRTPKGVILVGGFDRFSRYSLFQALTSRKPTRLASDELNITPRAKDTTYGATVSYTALNQGISRLRTDLVLREEDDLIYRAREIAAFLKMDTLECLTRLRKGFHFNHEEVAKDFRAAGIKNDDDLLAWYQKTEAYIWELTAYHTDIGWNYKGMSEGIAVKLLNENPRQKVIVIGDGVGTMSIALKKAGLDPVYHDLDGSRTLAFAEARFSMRFGGMRVSPNVGWTPCLPGEMDTVISFDFMEHLTDVEAWVREVHHSLKPGGQFLAQNAFNCGSGDQGPIPCHLERNDRYEKDWGPLMDTVGFDILPGNWWRKR